MVCSIFGIRLSKFGSVVYIFVHTRRYAESKPKQFAFLTELPAQLERQSQEVLVGADYWTAKY